jgi:hypothetical protein
VGLAPQRVGDLLIPLGSRVEITKHLKLVVLLQGTKILCGCFEFEALKVDLAPQRVGDGTSSFHQCVDFKSTNI